MADRDSCEVFSELFMALARHPDSKGEIVESVAGRRAISQRTSKMFKARVTRVTSP